MSNHCNDIKEFNNKFNLIVGPEPQHLTKRKLYERAEFLQEELDEFMETIVEQDLAGQADALIDLVYVALGTAVSMGLPWQSLWNDVHRANMAKVPGMTKRGHLMDLTKPEGWQGPETLKILINAGYVPHQENNEEENIDDACHKG